LATPIGCAPGATTGPDVTPVETGPITYATGSTDLVLQVTDGGGLLPNAMRLAAIPDVSVYGDGRVVSLGVHRAESQSPLLPQLTETRLTADAVSAILRAARDAGLFVPDRHYALPGAYDLGTVQFTVTANGATHRMSVFGMGFADEQRLAPEGDMAARRSLSAFYRSLLDLRGWLPAGSIGSDSAYQPAGTRVFMTRLVDWPVAGGGVTPVPISPAPGQDVRAWPAGQPVPESLGVALVRLSGWYCAVAEPPLATALGLATATWSTRWSAAGYLYQVVARPMLPHETGCPTTV
jgi:hypothetical protein